MKLGIYGAGGFGREVRETAFLLGKWDEIVYIDDFNNSDILDGSRRLSFEAFSKEFSPSEIGVVCALGDPREKKKICDRVLYKGYSLENVIHEKCEISQSAVIGNGVIIRAGVIVSVDVVIGDNAAVMENTYIGHGSVIGNGVHISPNVSIGGNVKIKEESFVGSNACIKERLSIGERSVVGLGAIVLDDVDPDTVFYNRLSKINRPNDLKSIF